MEDYELLIDLHKSANRQGPGGDAESEKALGLAMIDRAAPLKIADIGCGQYLLRKRCKRLEPLSESWRTTGCFGDYLDYSLSSVGNPEILGERILRKLEI